MIAVSRLLWVGVFLVALQYLVGAVLFLAYPDDTLGGRADAVVVLAGSVTRLPVAQALIDDGAAGMLLVSDDSPGEDAERERFCTRPSHPYRVICRRPDPFSTRVEARMAAEIARRESWNEIVVVTSRFHLLRTRVLFERCTDTTLVLRGASEPWYRHFLTIPSEWLKLAVAETTRRGC
jgi:hypothetical protein